MFRRDLLQRVAIGAGSLMTLGTARVPDRTTVTYKVKGFSCTTCAVGLDTILGGQKGVVRSKSIYPDGVVTVEFDRGSISEKAIIGIIAEQGFTVEAYPSR